jgi:phenylalanyl-tRNA synthetase alpha chain
MEQLETTLAAIAGADTIEAVEALRVTALGKQGWVSALLKSLGGMSPEERTSTGPRIHAAREAVTAALTERRSALENAALDARLAAETADLSLPAPAAPRGSVHPVSQVMDELAEIFADMGFAVATGPEIEDDCPSAMFEVHYVLANGAFLYVRISPFVLKEIAHIFLMANGRGGSKLVRVVQEI